MFIFPSKGMVIPQFLDIFGGFCYTHSEDSRRFPSWDEQPPSAPKKKNAAAAGGGLDL
jgi:hypothetical protein